MEDKVTSDDSTEVQSKICEGPNIGAFFIIGDIVASIGAASPAK